ncbi:MAG: type IV pilin [Asgard group archaeon]|nr:type IV pilin [Asgard group archaeon]
MLKTIKRLIRRRKAVSPVIAAILLIALTVISVAIVYFLVIPMFNTSNLYATVYNIKDRNKDSWYDEITLYVSNLGTKEVEISQVIIWTVPQNFLSDSNQWVNHEEWNFTTAAGAIVSPSDPKTVKLRTDNTYVIPSDQIELELYDQTYYRLEIYYSGQAAPYITDWSLLNEQADFDDVLENFETFDLQVYGLEGSIDVPGWVSNNYWTTGGEEHGPLLPGQNVWLPVPGQSEYVKFYYTGKIVIFHSLNGNLTNQPTFQQINRSAIPFRANKLYILGLAGSWGDEFHRNGIALTLNVTYTDGSSDIWDLGHDYIDDWWYDSNRDTSPTGISECVSAPYGMITEIDLGNQLDWPYEPIHTHTASFSVNVYKYIQYISFIDPGNDRSGPHLISISAA